ncbi:MAG: futalosine hydrolase [Saprospiraceae bacterium]
MKILICAATVLEMPKLAFSTRYTTLVHGAGIGQSAYHLTKELTRSKPDICIQIGIAGAFDRSLKIGELVQVVEDRFADLGAMTSEGNFIHLSNLKFADKTNPFEAESIINDFNIDLILNKVKAITVNTTSGSVHQIEEIIKMYNPQIETMEGASFFAICKAENLPCIQVRAISNYVEPRNTENWNIPLAIEMLERGIKKIISQLA